MYSAKDDLTAGFPHSEICGSKLVCQLPAAYRKLLRPSSHVIAKASTICTYSLDPITLSPCLAPSSRQKRRPRKEVIPGYRDISRLCRTPRSDLRERFSRYNHNPCCLHKEQVTKRVRESAPANQQYFFQIFKEQPMRPIRTHTKTHLSPGNPALTFAFATHNSQ